MTRTLLGRDSLKLFCSFFTLKSVAAGFQAAGEPAFKKQEVKSELHLWLVTVATVNTHVFQFRRPADAHVNEQRLPPSSVGSFIYFYSFLSHE